MEKYIFKCFKTPKKKYVYDRHTNSVFSVSDQEYDEFCKIELGKLSADESKVFQQFQKMGVLQENVIEEIENPGSIFLEHHAENRLYQLILQVTQQCNLRCGYCAYSGIYAQNRKHSSKRMNFETAKKAIDFFIERTSEMDKIHISFYGGEPLLEFDLMRRCVEYAKDMVEGKELTFGITTNGTLLTDEIVEFLSTNEFHLMISLDGSKKEHDANRKFMSGEGSFDLIMENVRHIKETFPEYGNKIMFNTVLNPKSNLSCVLEFFSTDDVLADNHIIFNSVNEDGLETELEYEESYDLIRRYEYLKVLLFLIGKISKEAVSKLMRDAINQNKEFYQILNKHYPILKKFHHNGPCMPGIRRLFITVDGKFFPCEKVSETSDFYCIGTLETGFSLKKMEQLLNIGKYTKEECKSCWILQNCSICADQFEPNEDCAVCKKNKLAKCFEEKMRIEDCLYEICVLREFGYEPVTGSGEAG